MDGNLRRLVVSIAKAVFYLLNARQDFLIQHHHDQENRDIDQMYRTIQNQIDTLNDI